MKRTCSNCAHASHSLMSNYIRCGKKHELRRAICQACKKWELSLELLNDAFAKSLDKARAKHPDFCLNLGGEEDEKTCRYLAENWKKGRSIRAVLMSEANEFLCELARGDLDRAISEAGDLIAVIYRALNGEWTKKENEK